MPLKFFASDIVMKENTQDGMEGVLFSLEFFCDFYWIHLIKHLVFMQGNYSSLPTETKGSGIFING